MDICCSICITFCRTSARTEAWSPFIGLTGLLVSRLELKLVAPKMLAFGIARFVVAVPDTDGDGFGIRAWQSSIIIVLEFSVGKACSLFKLVLVWRWHDFEFIVVLGWRETATVDGLKTNEFSRLPSFEF